MIETIWMDEIEMIGYFSGRTIHGFALFCVSQRDDRKEKEEVREKREQKGGND